MPASPDADFPEGFLFGSSRAAHQVEGGNVNNDWWAWEHAPGTPAVEPSGDAIEGLIREHFDLRPGAIIRDLDLRRPIYQRTASYGHFGREEPEFTWELVDKAAALRAAAGLAVAASV